MNTLTRLRTAAVAGALALAPLAAVAQLATGSFTQTVDVDTPVELDVRTGSGSISVRPGAADRVVVSGRIRVHGRFGRSSDEADALVREIETDPPVEVSGRLVRVGLDHDDYYEGVSVSYEIEVPAETELRSRTGSGSQRVEGLAGPVVAATGSGSVSLRDIGGAVEARTGSGSITAEGVAGAFNARTGSGSIRLVQTAPGDVEVTTGSGGADLSGVEGGLFARAGSGSIRVDGRPADDWSIQTGSGRVRLTLAPDAAFDVEARAGSGGIDIAHPVTVQGRIDRGRLTGSVRGGGPLLRLSTGSGGIEID